MNRGYSSHDAGRRPSYIRDPHVKGIGRGCWIRKPSWTEEKKAQEVLGILIAMGLYHRPRFTSDMPSQLPELGFLDERFDPMVKPWEVRCCRQNDSYEANWMVRQRWGRKGPARWCYNKPVLRVGDNWYCLKHSKNAPLPPWEGAPDLHYRPHSRSVGADDFRYIEGPMTLPDESERWLQGRVERELECTTDQLWSYIIGVGGAVGKLATMGGFRQDDGTMEPFYWRASDVVAYREKMQALAAKTALAHLGAPGDSSDEEHYGA